MKSKNRNLDVHCLRTAPEGFLRALIVLAVTVSLIGPASLSANGQASPPGQPSSGPGGSDYLHAAVTAQVYGRGAREYFIFEPSGPVPYSAPVIVFNHGWGATNPRAYGAWIEHIVRRGNVVIYPVYQDPEKWRYPPGQITPNAIETVKDAISRLQRGDHVKPELDKFAIVGHSAGGQVTANMAALAGSVGLPRPKAVMSVQPGKSWSKIKKTAIPLEDLSKIPPGTLLLAVVGDGDELAKDIDAKRIFYESTQVDLNDKDFITVVSDLYGSPDLIADHFSPVAPSNRFDARNLHLDAMDPSREIQPHSSSRQKERRVAATVNALDYYGFWKLFDGLCDAAFYGKHRNYALGITPEQRFMGRWSDGTPVKELQVSDSP